MNPDQEPVQPREPGDQRRAVALLELVEARAVDHPRNDFADVVGLSRVGADDAVDLRGVVERILGVRHVGWQPLDRVQRRHNRAADVERVLIVFGEVVGHSREARVDVGTAELLGGHFFARRGFHERRAAQKNRPRATDDDRFVGHRRHVGAAGRARAHHGRDLRDALRRHACLIEEDAAEVFAIGKHLGLQRQKRAPGIDQVDARQPVLQRDVLGAHVFLHRHRKVRAALDGGVVGDHHHFAARHPADAGDDAGAAAPRRRTCRRRRGRSTPERASPDRAGGRSARARAACPAPARARSLSTPPPSRARARRARRSATSWSIRSRLAWKTGSAGSTWVSSTGITAQHRLSGQSSVARSSVQRHQPQQSVLQTRRRDSARRRASGTSPPRRQRSQIILSDRWRRDFGAATGWAGFGVRESPMRAIIACA